MSTLSRPRYAGGGWRSAPPPVPGALASTAELGSSAVDAPLWAWVGGQVPLSVVDLMFPIFREWHHLNWYRRINAIVASTSSAQRCARADAPAPAHGSVRRPRTCAAARAAPSALHRGLRDHRAGGGHPPQGQAVQQVDPPAQLLHNAAVVHHLHPQRDGPARQQLLPVGALPHRLHLHGPARALDHPQGRAPQFLQRRATAAARSWHNLVELPAAERASGWPCCGRARAGLCVFRLAHGSGVAVHHLRRNDRALHGPRRAGPSRPDRPCVVSDPSLRAYGTAVRWRRCWAGCWASATPSSA